MIKTKMSFHHDQLPLYREKENNFLKIHTAETSLAIKHFTAVLAHHLPHLKNLVE